MPGKSALNVPTPEFTSSAASKVAAWQYRTATEVRQGGLRVLIEQDGRQRHEQKEAIRAGRHAR